MGLTNPTVPPDVGLAGNPLVWIINTDNQYSAAGDNAELWIKVLLPTTAGETFGIAWDTHDITFTCADPLDDSGKQFLPGATVNESAAKIADALEDNYYINKDFEITYGGADTVTIVAREKGVQYSITYDGGTISSTPTLVAGQDQVLRDYYELGINLWFHNGTEYVKVGEDRLPPDSDGNAEFDVSHRLYAELQAIATKDAILHFPDPAAVFFAYEQTELNRLYYIEYYEIYGDPPEAKLMTIPTTKYAFFGGLSKKFFGLLNDNSANYFTNTNVKRWLDMLPNNKIVEYSEFTRLYWRSDRSYTNGKVKVKIYHSDTGTTEYTLQTITFTAQSVYEVICTLEKIATTLGIANPENIYRFDIYLTNSVDTLITTTKSFFVDSKTYEHNRYFLYRNSLGVFGTIRTTGEAIEYAEYDREMTEKYLDYDHGSDAWQEDTIEVQKQDVKKVNTGWSNLAFDDPSGVQCVWAEFLISDEVYEIKQTSTYSNNYLIAINILSKKVLMHKDNQYLKAVEFEYAHSFIDKFHSEDIPIS